MFCSRCGEQVDTSSRFCPRCGQDLTALTGAGKAGATAPMTAQPPQENETDIVKEALKDEYELEKELGRGGMAVVYKARDKQLDREVAIKVLPFSLSFDAEFVERFQREARTAGKLEHPNIIPIYRVGKSGRVIYFVMKFIRGKSLSGVIETRGALPVPEIKRLLMESVGALGYAHKHGIVHRDIKPDNIMFDELGQAIVADFGIAKAQSGAKLTGTGMSIGTPHYMSPEQARAQNLDGRSDLYSLGVVAYQCLTGHVPFDGEDSFSIGYKHIMEELPVPSLDDPAQREMFGIIQKMMAKKPDDRFQTAEELVRALEGTHAQSVLDMATMKTTAMEPLKPPAKPAPPEVKKTMPLPRPSGPQERPKDPRPTPPVAEEKKEPQQKKPPLRPPRPEPGPKPKWPWAVAALLVLGAAGAGGFVMMNKGKTEREQFVRDSTARAESLRVAIAARSRDSTRLADSVRAESLRIASAKRDDSKKPGTSRTSVVAARGQGTVALSNVPTGAQVRVDGRPRTDREFKLDAGRHRIEVSLQGFRTHDQNIDVAAGQRHPISIPTLVAIGTPPPRTDTTTRTTGGSGLSPRCATDPNFNMAQRNGCWDQRASPLAGTTLTPPATCTGRVTPANILVHVSPTGEVLNASKNRDSSCADFTLAAIAQLENINFTPARKGTQNVVSWLVVVMRPAPR